MSNMNLVFDPDISSFLDGAKELEKNATLHSFILSLVGRYKESNKPLARMVRATNINGELIVAGIQTELERALIISQTDAAEAKSFCTLLAENIPDLPGINGPVPGVDCFASSWSQMKSCESKLGTNMRLFELTTVILPKQISGMFRLAQTKDEKIIFNWLRAFHSEAVPNDPILSDDELIKNLREGIEKNQFFVWEDEGKLVSLVGSRRETSTDRWIAPVYTPPELRGRGYASFLVASVSQIIVDSGKKAMLFTDLTNPTSNSIYQKIGFKSVGDFNHYFFV
jgi:predicted GNAT family acetyltransferase